MAKSHNMQFFKVRFLEVSLYTNQELSSIMYLNFINKVFKLYFYHSKPFRIPTSRQQYQFTHDKSYHFHVLCQMINIRAWPWKVRMYCLDIPERMNIYHLSTIFGRWCAFYNISKIVRVLKKIWLALKRVDKVR